MLPIVVYGATYEIMSTDLFCHGLEKSNPITLDNASEFPALLIEKCRPLEMCMRVSSSIPAYNINFFLFQLVTTKIFDLQWQKKMQGTILHLSKGQAWLPQVQRHPELEPACFFSRQGLALVIYTLSTGHGNMLDYLKILGLSECCCTYFCQEHAMANATPRSRLSTVLNPPAK